MTTSRLFAAAILAVLSGGGYFGWCWLSDRAAREELRQAEHVSFADAEPRLRRLAERRPDDAAVARALALGYLEANRLGDAEPYFARWCELCPNDAEPFRRRVQMWKELKRPADGVSDAERALQLDPHDPPLRRQYARWLWVLGRFAEAEQQCRRCLEDEPGHPFLFQLLAAVLHRQGRAAEATAVADALLRDHPQYGDALVLRGALYYEADQPKEAIACYRRALAIEGPHRQAAYYELSLALNRVGQEEEARKAMAESRLLHEVEVYNGLNNREPVDVQLRIAGLLLDTARYPEALRMLSRLQQQHPKNADVRRLLAVYHERQAQPAARKDNGQRTTDKKEGTNP
jgi:predicted Zn-dependent protease